MKVSLAGDRTGVPAGVLTAAAHVADVGLAADTLGSTPEGAEPAVGTPVVADKGYDSDPLREGLAAEGYRLIAPHRKNRRKPATNDGRRLRRYRRRYVAERTNSWLHGFRRAITRFEYYSYLFDGFVYLACAFIAAGRS